MAWAWKWESAVRVIGIEMEIIEEDRCLKTIQMLIDSHNERVNVSIQSHISYVINVQCATWDATNTALDSIYLYT